MKHILFLGLLALLLLAGCAGDPPDAAVVAAGPTAVSTLIATDPPTTAPEATATPLPTATVAPTVTASPTATSTATSTATTEPTDTPKSTDTPEPTATATATLAPTVASTAIPTVPAVDTAALLREQLNDVIAELGNYRWTITEPFGLYTNPTAAIDCNAVVNSHERIVTMISLDVSGSAPAVQNALATALQGVDEFIAAAGPWTDSCRQALAAGEATNIMGKVKFEEMKRTLVAPEALWNQAIHMLDE